MIKTSDGIERSINAMLTRGKNIQAYVTRVTFKQYQQFQLDRWASEGSSEGYSWPRLDPKYAEKKLTRFAGYPGAGKAMMIATGKLRDAAVKPGTGTGGLAIFTPIGMSVAILEEKIPYAKYAALARPFMVFGSESTGLMLDGIAQYIMRGQE